MEEESKMSFWKKIKTSIFGLEEYQKLAAQKVSKTIGYLAILMLIFAFFIAITLTCLVGKSLNNASQYIQNNIETLNFKDGVLEVKKNKESDEAIIIEDKDKLTYNVIVNTAELSQEQINKYTQDIKNYANGIVILKDEVILKTRISNMVTNISLKEISEQVNLVKLEKQDVINALSGTNLYAICASFAIAMIIYLFIIYFSTVLLDILLYSAIGYMASMFSGLRLKYTAIYNIATYSLTLPILLNLIYIIINILTGYTIKYFSIMYTAVTCIYIITAILMIKADLIKKQMELSKIIAEQEKVRQEMERREQEKKEEEEKEKIRKKDEEERKKEKKQKEGKKEKTAKGGTDPEPQANIKPSNT